MKIIKYIVLFLLAIINFNALQCQTANNCFLNDFTIKEAVSPPYFNYGRTTSIPTTSITIDFADTVSQVSKYIFGNAVAVWVSPNVNNPTVVGYLKKLSPSLIRFPGGSWSNIYFWNGNPGDLPSTIPDPSGKAVSLGPVFGPNQTPTFDSYLNLRDQIGSQGLITVNYGYARYGKSAHPAEQAAHLAAEWVRHDKGHTKFWEIGNENPGNWEAGWRIDTAANKDGQPLIINGTIYGQHFRIFSDSMKKAAAEFGAEIYIGAIIVQFDGTNSGNIPDRNWNASVYKEAGDAVDFYVVHNYFGNGGTNPQSYLNSALTSINDMHNFISKDIQNKKAVSRPVALTEWNLTGGGTTVLGSYINGIQSVLAMSEMAKLGYGMSCRWLIASWQDDGMFYHQSSANPLIPEWNPHADFFYLTYLQKYFGSYFLHDTITGSGANNIKAYTTLFKSGKIGIVLVNIGNTDQTVGINLKNSGYGNRYYYYSLTGGTDDPNFSKQVYVNDTGPEAKRWGPLSKLDSLKSRSDTLGYPVKIVSPKLSVQYILLESGNNTISKVAVNAVKLVSKNLSTSITDDNGILQLTANISPVNATNNGVIWSTSDSSLAIVDQFGKVKAMYNGNVKIKAVTSDGGFKDSIMITVVNQRYEVTSLKLSTTGNARTISTIGGTLQVTPIIAPINAENKSVSWKVSDTSIATISSTGLITAKKNGKDTITCVTNDGNFTAILVITVSITLEIQVSSLNGLKAYPIPTNSSLYIENEFPVQQYEILNINGELLKTINNPALKTEFNIENYKEGIYFIRAHSKTDFKVIKFIKL